MAFNDPHEPRRPRISDERFAGWGLPALIAAIIFVGGILLFSTADKRMTTASNDGAPVTTSAPAPQPPAGAQK